MVKIEIYARRVEMRNSLSLHYRCGTGKKTLNASNWLSKLITDGSETQQQQSVRSKRAKKPRASGTPVVVPEPDQRIDQPDQAEESPVIPTGFLSPSVKEYLELGKSIPGENKFQF